MTIDASKVGFCGFFSSFLSVYENFLRYICRVVVLHLYNIDVLKKIEVKATFFTAAAAIVHACQDMFRRCLNFFSECLRHAFVQVLCFFEENSSFTDKFLPFPVNGLCPYYLAVFQSFRRGPVMGAGAVPLIFFDKN